MRVDLDRLEHDLRTAGITAIKRYVIPERWGIDSGPVLVIETEPEFHIFAKGHAQITRRSRKQQTAIGETIMDVLRPHLTPSLSSTSWKPLPPGDNALQTE